MFSAGNCYLWFPLGLVILSSIFGNNVSVKFYSILRDYNFWDVFRFMVDRFSSTVYSQTLILRSPSHQL